MRITQCTKGVLRKVLSNQKKKMCEMKCNKDPTRIGLNVETSPVLTFGPIF